jgi:hypothetical protein
MARSLYQNTAAIAAADGTLKALFGVQVYLYQPGTTTQVTMYRTRGPDVAAYSQPLVTDATGLIEFYADVGEYDVRWVDSQSVPRIADRTTAWNALNGGAQGLPASVIQRNNALDLTALAPDVGRQMKPIGEIFTWWRPVDTIPLPTGSEICDGRQIPAANHDFVNADGTKYNQTITLPDMRNKFIIGADVLKSDGAGSNNGDGSTAFNVVNPNAPGIRGTGGSNTVKNLQHSHQFGHTHGIPGQTTGVAPADRSLAHAHSSGSMYAGGTNTSNSSVTIGAAVQGLAGGVQVERFPHLHSFPNLGIGGGTGGEASPDHYHYNSVSAVTTNSQSTTTTDAGTMSSSVDMRPQHVGLLMLMKVRRN